MPPTPVERLATVVEDVRAGKERAIARAMRVIDERGPLHRELLRALLPFVGRARVIGITGTPGAGKSTLVDQLVTSARAAGQRVARDDAFDASEVIEIRDDALADDRKAVFQRELKRRACQHHPQEAGG